MEVKPGDEGKVPTIEELSEQISNLNKGIAGYRDTASKAEARATAAEKLAAEAKAESGKVRSAIEEAKDEPEDDKVTLNPQDQKRLEAWAKAQGFVTKAEMDQQKAAMFQESIQGVESQAIEEFLKRFPQYTETEQWSKIKKEFEQYKQPTTITGYRNILTKIHKELSGDDEKASEVRAKEEQKKRLGLGGSGLKDNNGDDMSLDKLRERYPNLSEDQIISRLTEINKLAEDRAKKHAAKK